MAQITSFSTVIILLILFNNSKSTAVTNSQEKVFIVYAQTPSSSSNFQPTRNDVRAKSLDFNKKFENNVQIILPYTEKPKIESENVFIMTPMVMTTPSLFNEILDTTTTNPEVDMNTKYESTTTSSEYNTNNEIDYTTEVSSDLITTDGNTETSSSFPDTIETTTSFPQEIETMPEYINLINSESTEPITLTTIKTNEGITTTMESIDVSSESTTELIQTNKSSAATTTESEIQTKEIEKSTIKPRLRTRNTNLRNRFAKNVLASNHDNYNNKSHLSEKISYGSSKKTITKYASKTLPRRTIYGRNKKLNTIPEELNFPIESTTKIHIKNYNSKFSHPRRIRISKDSNINRN